MKKEERQNERERERDISAYSINHATCTSCLTHNLILRERQEKSLQRRLEAIRLQRNQTINQQDSASSSRSRFIRHNFAQTDKKQIDAKDHT